MFNAIPQLGGFMVAITFMSLPVVAVTMTPTGAFLLLNIARFLKKILPPDNDPDPRLAGVTVRYDEPAARNRPRNRRR